MRYTGTPTIRNVTLTNANTEYSQALAENCRSFSMQARGSADVRFAFETGKVAGATAPFATMKSSGAVSSPELFQNNTGALTLYFASGTAGTIVEIVEWSA